MFGWLFTQFRRRRPFTSTTTTHTCRRRHHRSRRPTGRRIRRAPLCATARRPETVWSASTRDRRRWWWRHRPTDGKTPAGDDARDFPTSPIYYCCSLFCQLPQLAALVRSRHHRRVQVTAAILVWWCALPGDCCRKTRLDSSTSIVKATLSKPIPIHFCKKKYWRGRYPFLNRPFSVLWPVV